MTQMTPAQLRAAAEEDLKPLGAERIKLAKRLEEIDRELRPKVVRAVEVELPYRRIAELTAVAPNTARAWVRKVRSE